MRVCCVCTGNTCRSPMLAALLERELRRVGKTHEVCSAGVAAGAGQPASPHARRCMSNRGLDIESHRSQALSPQLLADCEHFFCMTTRHAAVLIQAGLGSERVSIVNGEAGVPDPFGGDLSVYESCARVLEEAAHTIAARL